MAAALPLCLMWVLEEDDDDDDKREDDMLPIFGILLAQTLLREDHVRITGYVEDVVTNYTSEEFKRIYRMTKDSFSYLCQLLSTCPQMKIRPPELGGRTRITLEKMVLVTLRYLGHQCCMNVLADTFNISESSVVTCKNRVVAALNYQKDDIINWPNDDEKLEVSSKFEERRGFPKVIGAIDGTHIAIKAPVLHTADYINRKKFHSVILQAVCLPNMKFSHCVTGWPGSCHDSRVLKNTNVWEEGMELCGQCHLLGDGGYPLQPWLMTPYRDNGHLQPFQRHYNFVHSSTRCVIERAFGLLKGRFRRLKYIDAHSMQCVVDIIMACCVLHNFCISSGDVTDEHEFDDNVNDLERNANMNTQNGNINQAGILKRDELARSMFT